jgi:hypothetical protein
MSRSYDPTKETRWRALLSEWQASGEGVRDFCERHGLSEQNFYRWRRVLAERPARPASDLSGPPRFLAVALESSRPHRRIEVLLASGQRVGVEPGFDPATLAQVIAVLEGQPC